MADLPKDELRELHEAVGNQPYLWLNTARALLRVAKGIKETLIEAIYPEHALKMVADLGPALPEYGCYLMLLGFSIECALKGIWVGKGGVLVHDGKLHGVPGAGDHELKQLADAAGVALSNYEAGLLGGITAAIYYAGRYPIPKRFENWNVRPIDLPPEESRHFRLEDFDAALGLAERVFGELEAICKRPSTPGQSGT